MTVLSGVPANAATDISTLSRQPGAASASHRAIDWTAGPIHADRNSGEKRVGNCVWTISVERNGARMFSKQKGCTNEARLTSSAPVASHLRFQISHPTKGN
ncbi:hypothetical protein IB238_02025 [Rhizobium sp. ARZ01]|uniref:hypothetical protein n=1 Tax=Rhizobium sp. ARZ01 TaxID=2769313 RepID=UPI0017814BC9|nr:hypothetical protein [Rhizobium sp. ARZ01]MBD9371416.1 hypothetical protein [Rhizobium sp. ARZ01]